MDKSALHLCYGCGKDNPAGMQVVIAAAGGGMSRVEYRVKAEYCGHPGILHGGLFGVLFDEAMYHAVAEPGIDFVTLSLAIEYKSPARENRLLICEGREESRNGRKREVSAVLRDMETGKLLAEGRGMYLRADLNKSEEGGKEPTPAI